MDVRQERKNDEKFLRGVIINGIFWKNFRETAQDKGKLYR